MTKIDKLILPPFGSRGFNRLALTVEGKVLQRQIAAESRDLLRSESGIKPNRADLRDQ